MLELICQQVLQHFTDTIDLIMNVNNGQYHMNRNSYRVVSLLDILTHKYAFFLFVGQLV